MEPTIPGVFLSSYQSYKTLCVSVVSYQSSSEVFSLCICIQIFIHSDVGVFLAYNSFRNDMVNQSCNKQLQRKSRKNMSTIFSSVRLRGKQSRNNMSSILSSIRLRYIRFYFQLDVEDMVEQFCLTLVFACNNDVVNNQGITCHRCFLPLDYVIFDSTSSCVESKYGRVVQINTGLLYVVSFLFFDLTFLIIQAR